MANVSFARGDRNNLPKEYVDGRFIVAKDEHALYLDIDNETRIRLGDFVEVDTFTALNDIQDPIPTALYYVNDINVLAKYDDKTKAWKQINPDTGAVKVTKKGAGNSVVDITYNEADRTLELTMATYTTGEEVESKITAKVGDLDGEETVKAYVDKVAGKKADLGTAEDAGTAVTLYGVKKYSEEKAAEEAGKVKTTVVGTANDGADAETVHGAKKYAEEQIKAKLSSTYKPGGSAPASKFAEAPSADDEGKVYDASEGFSTNEHFVDGLEKNYPAGTNVVAIKQEDIYKWDVLSGFVDLTDYAKTEAVDTKIGTAKQELTGTESTIKASTIKEAAKEAETYADNKDTTLKEALIGTGDGVQAETIKAGVTEAKKYTDEKLSVGLAWGEF